MNRWRRSASRGLLALGSAMCGLVVLAPGASALSCVSPAESMPDAAHVFVGRVSDIRGDDIRLAVSEVWQGGPLAPQVWVATTEPDRMWMPWSGADGELSEGNRSEQEWVVATDGDFVTNACWVFGADEGLDFGSVQPDRPAEPEPGAVTGVEPEAGSDGLVAQAGVGGAAAAVLLGAGAWLRRRRLRRG